MEEYLQKCFLQSDLMPDLVSKMEEHLQAVREMAVIELDMTEYLSLIFFCNFDFQKYLQE